ncbi:MAG: 5'-methylthioadenosine/adenosylhomocysteine nucleosidase [Candidatus Riflemargulisbacteria bacterium]
MTNKIALLGAMPEEVSKLVENMSVSKEHQWNDFTIYEGTLENKKVIVAKSGVGKVMAALFTQYLVDKFSISQIIFTGLAGALADDLNIGDILIANDLVQHDMDVTNLGFKLGQIPYTDIRFIECDKVLLKTATTYSSDKHQVRVGRILTGDTFVTHEQQVLLKHRFQELQGDAVEMEGAAVALVAHLNKIPCIIIRTISDKADGSALINFNDFLPVASENSYKIISHILNKI